MADYKNFNTYITEDHHANVKESFKKLTELISEQNNKEVLDVGCATGALLGYLMSCNPDWRCTGIDVSEELLDIARERVPGATWVQGSATDMSSKLKNQYDLVTCFGVLGIFDEYDAIQMFDELIKCTKTGGEVIVFSQFNEMNADTQITHRKYDENGDDLGWEKGWNNYSMKTVKKWLTGKVKKIEFFDFSLPIDLEPKSDLVRSWTVQVNQERRLTNGLKLLIDLKFLKITK